MFRPIWIVFNILACGTFATTHAAAETPATHGHEVADTKPAADRQSPGDDVFGLTRVWKIHLEMLPEEWAKLQPTGGPRGPWGPGEDRSKQGDEETHKGGFGMEFPWAQGDLTIGDRTYRKVGLRYKGNFTYMAGSGGLKRPLKIDFDRHDTTQEFHGLKKINLNSGVTDPARARESLSFAIFRAAGVPAPRTAYAELTLTVPGKYDRELVGLYTLVEQVDKPFLKTHFKSAKGLLLKPEGIRGLEYLGDDWPPYEQRYVAKADVGTEQQRRLIAFVRLVNQADDERFRQEIGSYLDVDEFVRFLAVNVLLANLDSFLGFGHNYYLYLRPDTNRFVFIPWDLDFSVGTWPAGGSPEQQIDLNINHPYPGENKLIDRLLAMEEVKGKYQDLLKELVTTCFTKDRWLADLAQIEQTTAEPLEREAKAVKARNEGAVPFGPPGGMFPGMSLGPDFLKTFVEKRLESVNAQLAGKSEGYVPTMAFGPPPGDFGPGGMFAPAIIKRADADKNGTLTRDELAAAVQQLFDEYDKDKNGTLDEKEIAEAINRLIPPPDFGPGGPGGFPPGGPPPGGPGMPGERDRQPRR